MNRHRHRRVQIILRLYSSPAEVLMGFDIDSCCVAYDGTSVSTPSTPWNLWCSRW